MKLCSSACFSGEGGAGSKTKSVLSRQHAATENLRAEGFSRLAFVDEWGRLSRHQYRWAVRVYDANPVHVRLIDQQSRGRCGPPPDSHPIVVWWDTTENHAVAHRRAKLKLRNRNERIIGFGSHTHAHAHTHTHTHTRETRLGCI
jgi:hypothetical protein